MKAKHVFTTLGLAFTMGIGVIAGLATHKSFVHETKAASAGDTLTFYCDVTSASWWSNNNGVLKLQTWNGSQDVQYDGTWLTATIFKVADVDTTSWTGFKFVRLYDGGSHDFSTWNTNFDNRFFTHAGSDNNGAWSNTVPPATQYTVTTYVDGVAQDPQQVLEGDLPADPALTVYGKGFDGWYSDSGCTGAKVTEITSDTTVYGKTYNLPQWSYKIDVSRVSTTFAHPYLYAFESNDRHNAAWPGAEIEEDYIIVPNDAQIIITNGGNPAAQTEDVVQSFKANDTLRVLNDKDAKDHYKTAWTSSLDEPAEDGYYLVSSKGDWKYDNAKKMTFNNDYSALDAQGNIAILLNVALAVDEEIKVRSFINDVDGWYSVGTSDQTWGEATLDGNWKTLVAGNYDIFYKDATFYISQAAERYTIGVVDRLYRGSTLISYDNGVSQMATAGVNFEPIEPTRSGYSFIGFYTDVSCTTEYVEKQFTGDDTLYAKFEMNAAVDGNNGIYMVGDATFTGNADYAWNVQGATYIYNATNDTANNLYEGTIVIPNSASELTPVSVRLAFYNNGVLNYGDAEAELGMSYSFVGMDSNNYAFNKGGTYAVYVTKTWKIYFNMGADAFYTKFLTDVGSVCQADGSTNVVTLQAVWAEMESAYNSLSGEDQAAIKAVGFNGGSDADDLHRVVAKYHYIVAKYGTEAFNDFIWEQTISPASNSMRLAINGNNTVLLVVVISSVAIIASLGLTFYFLRKRKYSK